MVNPNAATNVPQFQRVPMPGAEFLEEEPLYVNAKQYKRILKRRQARAKLEAEGKIPKSRQVSFLKCPLIPNAYATHLHLTLNPYTPQ